MSRNAYRAPRISLAAVFMLLLFAQWCSAAQTYTVRKGDTLHSIATRFGTTVSAIQKANNLKSSGISAGRTLTIPAKTSASAPPPAYGKALRDGLKVTSDGKVIATLAKDSSFGVMGRDGGSLKVKLSDGRTGWVDADAVKLVEAERTVQVADSYSRRYDLVNTALSCRGARYRRGGESRSGFDCSGFVKYVYSTLGIKLPHSSSAQYNYGKSVSRDELQEGDVLFFAGTYRRGISHVGLYIGGGKFIHASTRRTGVRVDDLNSSYYRSHYYGAKRLK